MLIPVLSFFSKYKLYLDIEKVKIINTKATKQLIINFFKHPMMTIKIIMAIHFEALRLWKKGVKLVKRKRKIKNNLSLEK